MVHVMITCRVPDFERQGRMITRLLFPDKVITARSGIGVTCIEIRNAETARLSELMAELQESGIEWEMKIVPSNRVPAPMF